MTILVEMYIEQETDKAYLLSGNRLDGSGVSFWIPKSLVEVSQKRKLTIPASHVAMYDLEDFVLEQQPLQGKLKGI